MSLRPAEHLRFSAVYGRYKGRCYLLEISNALDHKTYVYVGTLVPMKVHLVTPRQQLCLAIGYCDRHYDSIVLGEEFSEVQLSVKSRRWPPEYDFLVDIPSLLFVLYRTCRNSSNYNQYRCLKKALEAELASPEVPCFVPYQTIIFGNIKPPCTTKEDYKGPPRVQSVSLQTSLSCFHS